MEATKWLKPSISVSRIGDSASVQAATRVNAEQASKMSMCRPTRRPFRGRLTRLGEMSEEYAQPLHRGSGGGMYTRKAHETREAPSSNRTGNARSSCWQRLQASWVDRLSALGSRASSSAIDGTARQFPLCPVSDRDCAAAQYVEPRASSSAIDGCPSTSAMLC